LKNQLRDISKQMNRPGRMVIRDVRGLGLLVGLELARPELARRFVERCRAAGLILGWTLHSNTLIRLAPPLTITRAELDQGLAIMRASLS
jgi:4-aminobutyrate aminotransferase-like enzyme